MKGEEKTKFQQYKYCSVRESLSTFTQEWTYSIQPNSEKSLSPNDRKYLKVVWGREMIWQYDTEIRLKIFHHHPCHYIKKL